jgi:hypothetical protein
MPSSFNTSSNNTLRVPAPPHAQPLSDHPDCVQTAIPTFARPRGGEGCLYDMQMLEPVIHATSSSLPTETFGVKVATTFTRQ